MALDDEDAFAATVAPAPSGQPTPPPPPRARRPSELEQGATIAAPPTAQGSARTSTVIIGDLLGKTLPIVDVDTYQLDKEIARGGMGRIVAAEDQRLGRRVALKVLLEPSGDQLGRFQREALITARLQHPGIVPVYEAGRWPSGEPFFAMKLVSGRPLDRVIADTRTLDERLALLPRIAAATDAMAYAHNQRVVHRDLKPANVLIGDFGETVVIDWGLAKDLDAGDNLDSAARAPRKPAIPITVPPEGTKPGEAPPRSRTAVGSEASTLTIAGAVMGTPAYMAPEQARGEAVDQRADVFALGAMLYHLLAGTPPYNARTATDVIAAAALGRVVPLVEREERAPADLVAIVERAMAQDPDRRYAHAGELADELRRFLTGQLVSAHRYTRTQRVARFVRKHRAAVTIAAIALVGFAVGGTIAVTSVLHERDRAQHESEVAITRRDAAERLIDSLLVGLRDRLRGIGRLDMLTGFGADIQTYYASVEGIRSGSAADGLDRMAKAVDIVGSAERDLGHTDKATATFTETRDQLVAAVGGDRSPHTFQMRLMIARLQFDLGTCEQQKGSMPEARAAYEAAGQQYAALITELPTDGRARLYNAENHDRLGDLARNEGKLDLAFDEYSAGRADRQAAKGVAVGRGIEEAVGLSTSELKLGSVYQARSDSTAAFAAYRQSLHIRESILELESDNTESQMRVLEVQDALAELERELGDSKSAVATYSQAMPIMDALVLRDPYNRAWTRMRGNLLADLGFSMLDTGDFAGALAKLQLAREAQEGMLAKEPANTSWSMDLARTYLRAGDVLVALGRFPEAIAQYQLAEVVREKLAAKDPKSLAYARALAWAEHKLGNVYAQSGDLKQALAYHERALPLRTRLVAASPKHTGYTNELASTEIALGRLLASTDPARAETLVSQGLERARTLAAGDPASNEWKETVVLGLLARATVAAAGHRTEAQRDALVEAASVAEQARVKAPQNADWAGFLAEVQAGFAALAGPDHAAALAAWTQVRALLEPLDKAGQLPAPRQGLLARARAFK